MILRFIKITFIIVIITKSAFAQGLVNGAKKLIQDNNQNLEDSIKLLKDKTEGGKKSVIIKQEDPTKDAAFAEFEELPQNQSTGDVMQKQIDDKIITNTDVSVDDSSNQEAIELSPESPAKQEVIKQDLPNIKDDRSATNQKYKSIMLTDDELYEVENAIEAFKNNKPYEAEDRQEKTEEKEQKKEVIKVQEQSRVYLNSILYLSKNNWIAWINGDKIIKEDNSPDNQIYVKNISNTKAEIRWQMGISKWRVLTGKQDIDSSIFKINPQTNQIEINFTLRTNQTYSLIDNKVTEGKAK